MNQICSLDFLNKENFDSDIILEDGTKLFSKGDKVTPGLILKLYFQNIYKPKEIITLPQGVEVDSMLAKLLNEGVIPVFDEVLGERIPFDKEHAQRVTEYAIKLGEIMGFDKQRKEDLEAAAYLHDIGRSMLLVEEAEKPDFKEQYTNAGYDYLLNDRGLSIDIAEVARDHMKLYSPVDFSVRTRSFIGVPLVHIVAIANFYDILMTKIQNKKEVLATLLRIGGKRFNIFLLHKFISIMRTSGE